MLDLYGSGYVFEHVLSSIQQEQRQRRYQNYIADVLRLMGENVAGLCHGMYITTKWSDMADPQKQEERNADDIARDIIKRAGLRATESGG